MNNSENEVKPRSLFSSVPRLKLLDCSLRLYVIPLIIASLWLLVTDHQFNPDYGNVSFSNFTGIKYMVAVSAVAIGYAFTAAICSCWLSYIATIKPWVLFVSDQVMAYLLVTSGAVGAEITYLAYRGNPEVTWSEACSVFGFFCGRLKVALVLHFCAILGFLVLAVVSAYRAFSEFEAPPRPDLHNYEPAERAAAGT